jgi:hypothetical protein
MLFLVNQSKRTIQLKYNQISVFNSVLKHLKAVPKSRFERGSWFMWLKAELKLAGKAVLELNLPESNTSTYLKAIQPPTCSNHNATCMKVVKFQPYYSVQVTSQVILMGINRLKKVNKCTVFWTECRLLSVRLGTIRILLTGRKLKPAGEATLEFILPESSTRTGLKAVQMVTCSNHM